MSIFEEKPDLMERIICLAKKYELKPNVVTVWSSLALMSNELLWGLAIDRDKEEVVQFLTDWTELCEHEVTEEKHALLAAMVEEIFKRMATVPKITLPKISVPPPEEAED